MKWKIIFTIGMLVFSGLASGAFSLEESRMTMETQDGYDMVIIAPSEFADLLQSLVDHKNSYGINTILETTENIYNGYNGIDKPEQIKNFIKDMYDKYDHSYVLLVGGLKHSIPGHWYVPVRYVTVKAFGYKYTYISDLYYADIYNPEMEFQTWDSNHDGIYGSENDVIDFYPDVCVGRWPCRNLAEVKTMVEKTIKYEKSYIENKKILLIGGDTFKDPGETDFNEGEVIVSETGKNLPNFEHLRLFSSEITIDANSIMNHFEDGILLAHFNGHGWITLWNTYRPIEDSMIFEPGLGIWEIPKCSNKLYPVVVLGGCNTAKFDVTMFNDEYSFPLPHNTYGLPKMLWFFPTYESICWFLTRKPNGGSIACLGFTNYCFGASGETGDLDSDGVEEPDCVEFGNGFLENAFFKAYGINNCSFLGDCWLFALELYHGLFGDAHQHRSNIESFILIGDPSLKIGGYQ